MNESVLGNGNTSALSVEDMKGLIGEPEPGDESSSEESYGEYLEFLSRLRGIFSDSDDDEAEKNEEDTDAGDMDADDYHNKAIRRARCRKSREAAEICMEGLKKFPLSVDLLADTIRYSSEAGDMRAAADHYSRLKASIPFHRWNWRAFTFAFDYLLSADPIANEDECRVIIDNYKRFLPYEEKASMAESELEAALGNANESMSVLVKAIQSLPNASQCALRLADMQMDRGLFSDVLMTTNYGIAASAEVQPSINIPYLYLLRALAKDHILHKKECAGEHITRGEVEALSGEYELLTSEFPELTLHAHTIQMRVKMLKFIKAE